MKRKITNNEEILKSERCALCDKKAKYKILIGSDSGKQLCEECMIKYTGNYK